MKIIENYTAQSSNQLSKLVNDIIREFWNDEKIKSTLKNRQEYYSINRAINDAILKNIEILNVRKTIDYGIYLKDKPRMEAYTKHEMANKIANMIVESPFFPIRKFEHFTNPEVIFETSIPFIKWEESL